MLQQTFIHIPHVGLTTEKRLWLQGCRSWDDYRLNPKSFKIGGAERAEFGKYIERSSTDLSSGAHQMFAVTLGEKFAWRALPDFPEATVYLDIETDGGMGEDSTTVIGCYDGKEFRAFVRGDDMESFRDYISRYSVIVTFFGSGFDMPMLRRRFPTVPFDHIHIDLCAAGRLIGLRGGLKVIEKTIGIERTEDTKGLNGFDAVRLWRSYRRGNDLALDLLIEYNREDTVNLKTLGEYIYPRLRAQALDTSVIPARRKAFRARWTP